MYYVVTGYNYGSCGVVSLLTYGLETVGKRDSCTWHVNLKEKQIKALEGEGLVDYIIRIYLLDYKQKIHACIYDVSLTCSMM